MAFKIICDGSSDLFDEQIKEAGIDVLPYYVSFDSEHYYKERVEMKVEDFYQKMIDNPDVFPKTSTVTYLDYYEAFEKYAREGIDIIYLHISSKLSASYANALLIRNEIVEKFNIKMEVIDSTVVTCLEGLLVLEAARMKKDGKSYEEVIEGINRIKGTGRIFFTVKDMTYLVHGGRVGKVKGLIGATLKIKPMIVFKDGELFPLGIVFTQKQAIVKLSNQMFNYFAETGENIDDYIVVVGYGAECDRDDLLALRNHILKRNNQLELPIGRIGATIGVHTGPHPMGVGFIKKYDR